MSAIAQQCQLNYVSEGDYLEGEKHSEVRHEYVDGQVYAMAGTTKRHNEIAVNISTALRIASRGSLCKVYSSAVKVRAIGRKAFYYLENPCLIVEVLSDSTEKRDRSEKLLVYMNISTLRTYLLVAQDKPEVEMFYREPDGSW